MTKNSDTGYLFVAVGRKQYAELAANAAATLRASDPFVKIALICDFRPDESFAFIFDELVQIAPAENPYEVKTRLYELTPFKRTLYMDADGVIDWRHYDAGVFITGMRGKSLAMCSYGVTARPEDSQINLFSAADVWRHYGLEGKPVHALQSSAIYFEKSRKAQRFFRAAREAFGKYPKAPKPFPDELAFIVAAATYEPDGTIPARFMTARDYAPSLIPVPFIFWPGQQSRDSLRVYNAYTYEACDFSGIPRHHFRK